MQLHKHRPFLMCFLSQYGGPMPGMPAQGMPPHGMPGGPMGGPMPGHMGGPMGGAPPQGGYASYGGGYPGTYGAASPAANDPMWGYFTAIAGQVSVFRLQPHFFLLQIFHYGLPFTPAIQVWTRPRNARNLKLARVLGALY